MSKLVFSMQAKLAFYLHEQMKEELSLAAKLHR